MSRVNATRSLIHIPVTGPATPGRRVAAPMKHLLLTTAALLFLFTAGPLPAAAQHATTAGAYVRRGVALMAKNDVAGAIEWFTKAIQLDPRYAEAYVKRGLARRAQGDLNGSIEDYEKARGIDPRSTANRRDVAESYHNRGFNKMNSLDIEGALLDFDRAVEIYPSEADYYLKRGEARLIKEDFAGAVADFDKALGIKTSNPIIPPLVYADRGYALLLQGKEEEARKDFERCSQSDSGKRLNLELHLLGIKSEMEAWRKKKLTQSGRGVAGIKSERAFENC
jgi:tetratricopeptide (TPR) repeat protein